MKLFEELKRRNVFRVAGVYAVVGWLLAQAAGVLENSLNMPGWFDTVIVSALLIAFPIAMILAWAFEMTPEGVKLTANVPEGESIAPKTGRKLDYAILGGLALVGVMIVADRLAPSFGARQQAGAPQDEGAPSAMSIAVLPFADLSPGGGQDYFSQGIAEEILNVLANVSGLEVASRTSSFQFKGQEKIGIPLIAEQLHVRHILEGSVRKAGDTIRITAQLIDAETDKHLWSESFDRTLTTENIFAVQDEITKAIVEQLSSRMTGAPAIAAPAARAADTQDTDAYELYLRGHQLFINRGGGLREAILLLEQAVGFDPDFARAWAELAAAAAIAPSWDILDRDYRAISVDAAERAIALDPSMALPYAAQGQVNAQLTFPPDWEAAAAKLDKALALEPNNTTALAWRATISESMGYLVETAAYYRRCLEIDPASSICGYLLSLIDLIDAKPEAALGGFEDAILNGFSPAELHFVGPLLERGDRIGAAAVAIAATGDAYSASELIAALDEKTPERRLDRMMRLKAGLKRGGSLKSYLDLQTALVEPVADYKSLVRYSLFYIWLPEYAEYRRTDGFKKLATAVGLPAYWRKHGFTPQCHAVGKDDFECE